MGLTNYMFVHLLNKQWFFWLTFRHITPGSSVLAVVKGGGGGVNDQLVYMIISLKILTFICHLVGKLSWVGRRVEEINFKRDKRTY